jgi:hypothetical protein
VAIRLVKSLSLAHNFRHHDEWARIRSPNPKQKESIVVIEAILNTTATSHASVIPWRRNACADVILVISRSDFATLEQGFFEFAKAMCD